MSLEPEPLENSSEVVRLAAMRIAALAENGLTFSTNLFDLDRYKKLRDIAAEMFALLGERTLDELKMDLGTMVGYVTPKIEVRGALVDERNRLLMMREVADGRWSLPGGFADPLDTPSEAVVREVLEETGYGVEVTGLVGCWDRDRRGHVPRLPNSIYKLFFLCRATGAQRPPDELETLEVGWFGIDELPELSAGRVNRWEIERVLAHHRDPSLPAEFD